VEPQAAATHTSPFGHAALQAPQLSRSTFGSTHDWPHWMVPPPQLVAQLPLKQTVPWEQALPHEPQFVGSL
jgi:hypothetical protein